MNRIFLFFYTNIFPLHKYIDLDICRRSKLECATASQEASNNIELYTVYM